MERQEPTRPVGFERGATSRALPSLRGGGGRTPRGNRDSPSPLDATHLAGRSCGLIGSRAQMRSRVLTFRGAGGVESGFELVSRARLLCSVLADG